VLNVVAFFNPPVADADISRMMKKNTFVVGIAALFLVGVFSPSAIAAEPSPRSTDTILGEISQLLSEYRFQDAIALFDSISPADAEAAHIKLLKASVLSSAGQINEARQIAQEITKDEPDNTDALFVLSAIEGAAGRAKEQKALLEQIVKADPANAGALTDLGTINLNANSLKAAAQYFDQALAIEPQNLEALLGRSRVFRLNRDPKSAAALLNRALEAYPEEALAWHERARLYRGAGEFDNALQDLDKATKLDPADYWIALDRGNVLLDLGRKADALVEYERAVKINPREFLAYAYTAGIKDDLGDFAGAGRDYERLAALRPDYYFAYEGVGMHKMKEGKYIEAKDAFIRVYAQVQEEWWYALLAAVNWMKGAGAAAPRQFLNDVLKIVKRDTIEYNMLRLYYDLSGRVYSGENDVIRRVDQESVPDTKARMLFYLATYYDIRGTQTLADKYFQQFRELDRRALPEWRLAEWIMEERGLIVF
jgi:tetratricopeptide (TPR) repeat protein